MYADKNTVSFTIFQCKIDKRWQNVVVYFLEHLSLLHVLANVKLLFCEMQTLNNKNTKTLMLSMLFLDSTYTSINQKQPKMLLHVNIT